MQRLVIALAVLLVALPAAAATLAGVALPDSVIAGDQPLALNGMAVRSEALAKLYVAALYLPAPQRDAKTIRATDQPRRMEMRFLRSFSANQLCDSWNEGLAANVPAASAELKRQFGELCKAMRDVEPGGRISLTYLPGLGTEVDVDGKGSATIVGREFADALLACWLGDRPQAGEEFKQALLEL